MRTLSEYPNLFIVDHPLVQHKLSLMRDRTRSTMEFRDLLKEASLLLGYEVTRDMPLTLERIETPLEAVQAPVLHGRKVALVAILRAGLVMVEGLRALIPAAREGHIGLYRDPATKRPVEYLVKLPDPAGRLFIVADPMLATGHSAVHAVDVLVRHGVPPARIRFLALVCAPEGIGVFQRAYPNVPVHAAALDRELDDHAYIRPGLGDAGDRMFGTR